MNVNMKKAVEVITSLINNLDNSTSLEECIDGLKNESMTIEECYNAIEEITGAYDNALNEIYDLLPGKK